MYLLSMVLLSSTSEKVRWSPSFLCVISDFHYYSFWICYPRCRSSHISPSLITKRQDPKILGPILPEYLFTDPTGRRDTWSYVVVIIKEDTISRMSLQYLLKSWNYAMNEGPSHLQIVCYARTSILMESSCWHFHSAINFSEYDREPSGQVNLIGRVKSVLVDSQAEFILILLFQEPSWHRRNSLSWNFQGNIPKWIHWKGMIS